MKYLFYTFIAGSVFLSCNSNETTEKNAGQTITEVDNPTMECFVGNSGKDTIIVNLTTDADKVTGTLSYKFFEKDSNHGTIDGSLHGDTILATYSFAAEGTSSEREVAFLKKDNSLAEGYGDMEEKDGKMKFKSPANLSFGRGFMLVKVQCQ
jgi:hypothetical protein